MKSLQVGWVDIKNKIHSINKLTIIYKNISLFYQFQFNKYNNFFSKIFFENYILWNYKRIYKI